MSKSEILKGIINCLVESIVDTDNGEDLEELKELMEIYNNLNDSHKKLLSEFVDGETTLYEGDIIRKDMDKWYNENCK